MEVDGHAVDVPHGGTWAAAREGICPQAHAELRHGRRRRNAVADDVADREPELVSTEFDDVVPVAPDLRLTARREIASGHVDARRRRELRRQQAALQHFRDAVLALVEALEEMTPFGHRRGEHE